MIRNKLALDVFYEFVEKNGRQPNYKEFTALGYSKPWFYKTRDKYNEIEANNETAAKQIEKTN